MIAAEHDLRCTNMDPPEARAQTIKMECALCKWEGAMVAIVEDGLDAFEQKGRFKRAARQLIDAHERFAEKAKP